MGKVGKPVDRTEWGMSPQTVNAYYNPQQNEIVFPAAILQPPFFDPKADPALNYGGIGAVIGHEMHARLRRPGQPVRRQGQQRQLVDGGRPKGFEARTGKLVKQFDDYVAIDGMHVKGQLTLGENIADLGGITVAYDALQKALADEPASRRTRRSTATPRTSASSSTGRRCGAATSRPEELKVRLNTDPHAPANFRAIGAPSNHAVVRAGVPVQAGRQDGPLRRQARRHLVILRASLATGCRARHRAARVLSPAHACPSAHASIWIHP